MFPIIFFLQDMVLSGEANGLQLFERLFVFLAYQRSEVLL